MNENSWDIIRRLFTADTRVWSVGYMQALNKAADMYMALRANLNDLEEASKAFNSDTVVSEAIFMREKLKKIPDGCKFCISILLIGCVGIAIGAGIAMLGNPAHKDIKSPTMVALEPLEHLMPVFEIVGSNDNYQIRFMAHNSTHWCLCEPVFTNRCEAEATVAAAKLALTLEYNMGQTVIEALDSK